MSDNQHGKHQSSSQQETPSQIDAEKRKFLIATSAVGA
ncbi:MAG: ubiquinol-cytochrome c reductase iron-sulfur subunit, partial [Bacteroidia bacterium]|nr:ubiquinol-cytochrome c reductase iron-sulfur subunit [Methylotenera sp.]